MVGKTIGLYIHIDIEKHIKRIFIKTNKRNVNRYCRILYIRSQCAQFVFQFNTATTEI